MDQEGKIGNVQYKENQASKFNNPIYSVSRGPQKVRTRKRRSCKPGRLNYLAACFCGLMRQHLTFFVLFASSVEGNMDDDGQNSDVELAEK